MPDVSQTFFFFSKHRYSLKAEGNPTIDRSDVTLIFKSSIISAQEVMFWFFLFFNDFFSSYQSCVITQWIQWAMEFVFVFNNPPSSCSCFIWLSTRAPLLSKQCFFAPVWFFTGVLHSGFPWVDRVSLVSSWTQIKLGLVCVSVCTTISVSYSLDLCVTCAQMCLWYLLMW